MTCRDLAELLIDYVADELPAEQAEHIRQHLADCSHCVCYIETYRLTIRLTRQLPAVEPPQELLERLRAAVEQNDRE
jgi:anti-sigma factor RsiW